MSPTKSLHVERGGPVALIELARPDAANALDEVMATELATVATELDADPSVRAVVLTARGTFFCAGGDVKAMASFGDSTAARVKRLADEAHRAISSLARMDAPLVVAINGIAAGGGFSLAMAGDLVLAGESARFVLGYTDVGLSPDGSSTYFLPRVLGLRKTQELLFMNRRLSAQESLAWGLVHRVVPDAALRDEALGLARRLAEGPRGAHAAVKRLLLESYGHGLETQMELEGRRIASCAASAEGQEGLRAFVQKRAPDFSGGGGPSPRAPR